MDETEPSTAWKKKTSAFLQISIRKTRGGKICVVEFEEMAYLSSSPLSLRYLRAQMHGYRVHPAPHYCSEQEPYLSSRVEAAPFLRASHAQAPPSPSALVRAAPPADALLPREAASLPARVPLPQAVLHPMTANKLKEKRVIDNPHTASAPIHRSSNMSRVTFSDLDKILIYLLSSASVCSSCSARR